MGQPKKLSHKQKQEKKFLEKLVYYRQELTKLNVAVKKKPDEVDTWRWASLQLYHEMTSLGEHSEVEKCKNIALHIARTCQEAVNFRA
jgi:hypothetical protein